MQQVLFRIPVPQNWAPDGIPIYGFGMMLFVAFLACTWLAGRRAVREGISKETIQDLAIWIFVGGLLGARITYLLQEDPRPSIGDMLSRIYKIWDGGIILYGAVAGGTAAYFVAYFLVYRKRGLSTLKLADVIAPSIAVGLCLGRLGCFLNGCCYGQVACAECGVVAVPFPLSAPAREAMVQSGYQTAAGFTLYPVPHPAVVGAAVGDVEPDSAAAAAGLQRGDVITAVNGQEVRNAADLNSQFRNWPRGRSRLTLTVQRDGEEQTFAFTPWTLGLYPTQLYEVISMLLLLLLLLAYEPYRKWPGQVMALLMMGYAVHRALNELLRDDPRPVGFERYSSYLLFLAGAVMFLWLQFKPTPAESAKAAAVGATTSA